MDYYRNGGILPYVLRSLLEKLTARPLPDVPWSYVGHRIVGQYRLSWPIQLPRTHSRKLPTGGRGKFDNIL